ncbi:unnamed protein product [Brassica napus]|uniref:(rape) hypothetical protein n=2 Tax=Brassica napus TaxID=3708 RepID=A0A816R4W0_BRANA|nr:unnamed protein product [Brassica napus]
MRIWCFHCFTDDHEEEENRNRGGVSHRLQKQSAMDDNNNNNKGGDFVGFDLNDRELGVAEMLAREENGAELERVRSSEIRSHQLVQGESSNEDCTMEEADHDSYHKRAKVYSGLAGKGTIPEDVGSDIPSESSEGGKENVVEPSQVVKAMLSESQTQATTDLSDTLDAAWIGEQTASENNGISRPPSRAASANGTQSYDLKLSDSESGLTSNEEQTMQVQMPSPSFYYSLNKNYSLNSRKHIMAEDRPVYVSSYRELEWQSGARLLLPLGINDLVLPVYDDEPTSIIAYALTSSEYKAPFHFLILRSLSSADEQVSQLLQSSLATSSLRKLWMTVLSSNKLQRQSLNPSLNLRQLTSKYLTGSICTKSPTSLAKILGIYQVSSKHLKGGKEFKMDVLVMENLLFKRNFARLYDLKGSTRARYNPDTSGSNTVLLDQNLVEAMPTSSIFVGSKAKRLLERAVWNDTSFLASIHVMDYSLLVGVDEERSELVLGTIDFMRQYTWDKHLETWVKTSGLLGGQKNSTPTVISPQQYKKRFRKAMTAYFLMVPDQWSPATAVPSNNSSSADVKDDEERDDRQGVAGKNSRLIFLQFSKYSKTLHNIGFSNCAQVFFVFFSFWNGLWVIPVYDFTLSLKWPICYSSLSSPLHQN